MATIEIGGQRYAFDENTTVDISIPLRFDGSQPNAYGVERATSTACEYGGLVGDTRRGGPDGTRRMRCAPAC